MTPPKCSMCLKRMREMGGNGTCPVFRRRQYPTGMTRTGSTIFSKVDDDTAWSEHLSSWPDGCINFQAGDRRIKAEPNLDQESFFRE